ncbi:glyoxalase family protein, partial [Vibrio parahaemolyticus]
KADCCSQTNMGGALLVFYSSDIEGTLNKVVQSGGEIIRPIFEFPGGCRFHFLEPSGNEFAVWSEARV